MNYFDIVIDTNVILSALYSRNGVSNRFLPKIDSEKFSTHISVSLLFEYEDVLFRNHSKLPYSISELSHVLNYICDVAVKHEIFYLWRPTLSDPKDDHILELAIAGNVDYIVTYNLSDFRGIDKFGIKAIVPHDFLKLIGE